MEVLKTSYLESKDAIDRALEKLSSYANLSVEEFASEIAELISILHKTRDYVGIVFEGPQGTRKTSLALLILYNVYGDWDLVIESTYFTIPEFLDDSLSALKGNYRVLARLLDDFGFGEGSKWRPSSELADLLEYMNIIRTIYTSLLFTYVDDSAAKFVRQNASIKAIMNRVGLNEIEVAIYRRKYTVMGPIWKRVLSFKFNKGIFNSFPGFLEAYKRYWEKRRSYAILKGERLKEGMDRKKQLLFATIFGYYIGKYGYPFRDLLSFMRGVLELQFRNEVAVGINRLVQQKLDEYEIYPRVENGKQETKDVKRKVKRRSRKQGSNVK